MNKIKALWQSFTEKNPKLSQWVREGGLFFIVSNLITVFKFAILTFLPAAFAFLGSRDFGFPGVDMTLFGISFKWYIIGYGAEQGGIAYFTAYMIAMFVSQQHSIDVFDICIEHLLSEVRTAVNDKCMPFGFD